MTTIHLNPLHLARFALLLFVAAATPALAAPVGFVTTLDGIAQIQPENATTWQPAAIDGSVSVGDSIRTERNSLVKVLLVDDTILTVGEESEVFIDRMIVGDLATQERSILREMRGQVRAQVGSAFGGTTRLEIHTPTAIVGVRGSTMNVKVHRRRGARGWVTQAAIEDGTGFACMKGAPTRIIGNCVDLMSGELSTIFDGEPPSAPAEIPAGFDSGLSSGVDTAGISGAEPDVGPSDGVGAAGGDAITGSGPEIYALNPANGPLQPGPGPDQAPSSTEDVFTGTPGEDGSGGSNFTPDPGPPPPSNVPVIGPDLPGANPVEQHPGTPSPFPENPFPTISTTGPEGFDSDPTNAPGTPSSFPTNPTLDP